MPNPSPKQTDEAMRGRPWNTVVWAIILVAACSALIKNKSAIEKRLKAFWEKEAASSRLVEAMAPPGPSELAYPAYRIKIQPERLRQIQSQVQELIKRQAMTDGLKIWHPAVFYHGDEQYPVKIRLRGDRPDHWSKAKKSWRIRFKKDRLFQGRREIDLIVPHDKAYEVEKVAYDVARENGLLVPDAGFNRLMFNGVDFGLYFWIEKYGPEMLEKQAYPPGEIFRQANIWLESYGGLGSIPDVEYHPAAFRTSQNNPGSGQYVARFHRLVELIHHADDATFLKEFPQLVHVDRYLTWNAITWLFGSVHAHWSDNLRWYHDNTSGLLEPILYDVNRFPVATTDDKGYTHWAFEKNEHDRLAKRLFGFAHYRQRRNEILWRLLNDSQTNLPGRCRWYYQQLRPKLLVGVDAAKGHQLDGWHDQTVQILDKNRRDLHRKLSYAKAMAVPVLVRQKNSERLVLQIQPDCYSHVLLHGVHLQAPLVGPWDPSQGRARCTLVDPNQKSREISGQWERTETGWRLAFEPTPLWMPVDGQLQTTDGKWQLRVPLPRSAVRWSQPGVVGPVDLNLRHSLTDQWIDSDHRFVSAVRLEDRTPVVAPSAVAFMKKDGNRWRVGPGTHRLLQTVVVPEDQRLVLEPGAQLQLGPGVSLLAYSAIEALGTKDRPIVIRADRQGEPFGSVAVVRAAGRTLWRHVHVSGGSEAHLRGIHLSGQLCFYHADVDLEKCHVTHGQADDGLNIKKAKFAIRQCVFEANASDAFDGDWVQGTISNSLFLNNAGDGADFSGSQIAVQNTRFTGMGDKALSVGEKTTLVAFNCIMEDSAMAMAVKDLSKGTLYACVLSNNGIPISVYRKKQIFGGGEGVARACLFVGNKENCRLDAESKLWLVACGADRKGVSGTAKTQGWAVAEPWSYYTRDFRHDPDKLSTSPFRVLQPVGDLKWQGIEIPPRLGKAMGLVDPDVFKTPLK